MPFIPLLTAATASTGMLVGVALAVGSVLPASAPAQRVNFTGSATTWLSGTPTITPSAGSLGAITVDSNTTAHANYTAPATAQTVTFTDSTDGNSTGTLTVVAAATGYSLAGPASGTPNLPTGDFVVTLTPAGSAVSAATSVTPAISPDGTASATSPAPAFPANTAAASAIFQVTPTAAGAHTVSTTNSGGLTNPAGLSFSVVGAPAEPPVVEEFARPVYGAELLARPTDLVVALVRPVYVTEVFAR